MPRTLEQLDAALAAIEATLAPVIVTAEPVAVTAEVWPFPDPPTVPLAEANYNVPTTDPATVVERARYSVNQAGLVHVSSADTAWHWGLLLAHKKEANPLITSALASFKDPLVWFVLYQNARFNVLDAIELEESLTKSSVALTQTLAEFVASEAVQVGGLPSGPA